MSHQLKALVVALLQQTRFAVNLIIEKKKLRLTVQKQNQTGDNKGQ